MSAPRWKSIAAMVVVFALTASACSDDATPTTAPTDTTGSITGAPTTTLPGEVDGAGEGLELPENPNPLTVTATTIAEAASSAEIGPDGGTMTAVGTDGTSYTLSVPQGALFSPEEITMTPVASIGGLPDDIPVWGVLFEPEGLVFLKSASLTVELPPGTDTDDLFAAGTYADGADFHLTSKAVDGTTVTLDVHHFTLRLIGNGRENMLNIYYEHPSGRHEAHVASVEEALDIIYLRDTPPNPASYATEVEQLLGQWLFEVELDLDRAATSNVDETIDRALADAHSLINWLGSTIALLEGDVDTSAFERLRGRAFGHIFATLETAALQAYLNCFRDVDEVARLYRLAAVAEHYVREFGYTAGADIYSDIWLKARDCGVFELQVTNSRFTSIDRDVEMITSAGMTVRLHPSFEDFDSIEGVVEFTQFASNFECGGGSRVVNATRPGTVLVRLDLNINIRSPQPHIEQVVVHLNFIEEPTEILRCGSTTYDNIRFWYAMFLSVHAGTGGPTAFIALPIVREGRVFAAWRFAGSVPSGGTASVRGTSDIVLTHTPGG